MTPRRAGFTLIEVCAAMGILAIVLSLSAVLLAGAMRTNQAASATLLQIRLHADLADSFRNDVAAAVATPDRLDDMAQAADCLILRNADGSHVVYQWEDEQLGRIVRTGGRETRMILLLGSPHFSISFERLPGDRPIVFLRLADSSFRERAVRLETAAVLGGDRR